MMFQRIFEKIKQYKTLTLIILLTVIALPITIIQVQKQQNLRQKASEQKGVSLQAFPMVSEVEVGDDLKVSLVLTNPEQKKISAIDLIVSYDPNLLDLLDFSTTLEQNSFQTIPSDFTTGTYHYIGVSASENLPSNNIITIGDLNFRAKNPGATSLSFPRIHVNASGIPNALTVDASSMNGGKYVIINSATTVTTPPSAISPSSAPISTPTLEPTAAIIITPLTTPTDIPVSTYATCNPPFSGYLGCFDPAASSAFGYKCAGSCTTDNGNAGQYCYTSTKVGNACATETGLPGTCDDRGSCM